jgi:hypothetical protein
MGEHQQQPWEILNPRDALVEAAKLNTEAMDYVESGHFESARSLASVAQSLSTYALASYKRDAP